MGVGGLGDRFDGDPKNRTHNSVDLTDLLSDDLHNTRRTVTLLPVQQVMVALIHAQHRNSARGTGDKEASHCVTQECVLAAENLINSIDTSVDPCQNFYKYACGKLEKSGQIINGSVNDIIKDKVTEQIRMLLEDESDINTTTNSIRYVKLLYKKCMNRSQKSNLQPLLAALGGWPVVNDTWQGRDANLTNLAITMLQLFGQENLLSIVITMDPDNTTNHIMAVAFTSPYLSDEILLNDAEHTDKIEAYKEYFIEIVRLIAADMSISVQDDKILSHWLRLIDFEKKLAGIFHRIVEDFLVEKNLTHLNNKFSLADLSALIDYVNMEQYFKSVMPDEKADAVLKGPHETQSRSKKCIHQAENIPVAVGALYVRNFADKMDKQEAIALADNMKNSLIDVIHDANWMDNSTKNEAIEKVVPGQKFLARFRLESVLPFLHLFTTECVVHFTNAFQNKALNFDVTLLILKQDVDGLNYV
uniref:Peptidase M13 N-terminal domain-containing protein n=1 Tax=Romanomermis culicivorax TaxID=13658 RepID=A0A915J638_ROMCU